MRLTAAETAKGQFLFRFIQVKKDNSDCLSQVELKKQHCSLVLNGKEMAAEPARKWK